MPIFALAYMAWFIYKGPRRYGFTSPVTSEGEMRLRNWRGEPINLSSPVQLA